MVPRCKSRHTYTTKHLFTCNSCNFRMLLEKQTIFSNNLENVLPYMFLGIYGTLQFIFFSLASLMIQNTSATALHLSLLSANYYTFVIGTLFLDYKVSLYQFLFWNIVHLFITYRCMHYTLYPMSWWWPVCSPFQLRAHRLQSIVTVIGKVPGKHF